MGSIVQSYAAPSALVEPPFLGGYRVILTTIRFCKFFRDSGVTITHLELSESGCVSRISHSFGWTIEPGIVN